MELDKVGLELLTDEDIIDYTRSDGQDRVLTSHKDLNLNKVKIEPCPGGVYDTDIFGSPYEDRCTCGKIRRVSQEPCPDCGARVFKREDALRRFGRIELPFYYLNDLRFDIFLDLFEEIFSGVKIEKDFLNGDLRAGGYSGRSAKKLGIKVFDTCQFEYDPKKNTLKISEFINDESKCSYEGLMKVIEEHFPEHLRNYKRLINRYYIVLPAAARPFGLSVVKGQKKMTVNKLSVWYSTILSLCCEANVDSNEHNYRETINMFETPGERVRYTALLRAMLCAGKRQATGLLNTSKKNDARNLYSVRVANSARCPIVPSTHLAVDELEVPVHVAYEMCREGFVEYLVKELNFTRKEAIKSTRAEYDNPKMQELFKKYAEDQVVLVNRM